MLITADRVAKLLDAPQRPTRGAGTVWATQDGDRVFVHYDGPECPPATWELFPAHFWDGKGPDDLLIGRWPD
ncbi:hypothetical protein [Mycolicibacterium phlei]|uniref:hypothetical protein n=1 Tax=Mycolicibacterium phlei TaxID=1771 RepID=UPI000682A660|nr:hypothetical protein [Mycolicibacterium phlei]